VSGAAQDGPDALSHLLLNAGDTAAGLAVKAVLVIATLLLARLVTHRLIKAVPDRIASSA